MFSWLKRKSFEKLIQVHLDSLMQLAYMKCENRELAEDLVQETCVKAYNSFLKKHEEIKSPKAWLFKILINTHIDFTRKKHLSIVELDTVDLEDQRDNSNVGDTAFFYKDLNEALKELRPEQRILIYLADVDEHSYKEISELLNIPIGTVMSRLYNARQNLRKLLAKKGYTKESLEVSR